VNVGNPHFVLFTEEPGAPTLDELGQSLSTHESFPEGANVEFVTGAHQGALKVRIFERGVGETQACGTGAAAVAFVAVERGWAKWPVTVKLAGGELVLDQGAGGIWLGGTTQILDSFRLPC
jgi:diaminopimelate epimerase